MKLSAICFINVSRIQSHPLKAHVVHDAVDGHKGGDEEGRGEANGAYGLAQGVKGVEEGV